MQDMLAVLRDYAPDTVAFDAFADQWFHNVVVPEYEFSDVTKEENGSGWIIRGTVTNKGTGRMDVEVAAVSGERWSDEDDGGTRSVVADEYRDARTTVALGEAESVDFEIRTDFDPEQVLVDPDVLVLQLNREAALFEFQ